MGGVGRLLVSSGDPVFVVTLADALRARGWTVVDVPLRRVPEPPPRVDVVLVDMADDDRDFERASRFCRANAAPAILVSAACAALSRAERDALGFAAYVAKPFSAATLIAGIEVFARERARRALTSEVRPRTTSAGEARILDLAARRSRSA